MQEHHRHPLCPFFLHTSPPGDRSRPGRAPVLPDRARPALSIPLEPSRSPRSLLPAPPLPPPAAASPAPSGARRRSPCLGPCPRRRAGIDVSPRLPGPPPAKPKPKPQRAGGEEEAAAGTAAKFGQRLQHHGQLPLNSTGPAVSAPWTAPIDHDGGRGFSTTDSVRSAPWTAPIEPNGGDRFQHHGQCPLTPNGPLGFSTPGSAVHPAGTTALRG